MDENTIRKVLYKDPEIAPYFKGVYSADEIPWDKKEEGEDETCFFIFNLDPSYEEGSHWVCIMLRPIQKAFYFDSYGMEPNHPAFEKFMDNYYEFNDRLLQNPGSTNCGQWCLYFIHHMIEDGSFKNFLKQFPYPGTQLYNDYLLSSKVRKLFKIDVWPLDQSFFIQQLNRETNKQ